MRRFFALKSQFSEGRVILDEEETRHLRDVLRLKAGEEVLVFDGEGSEFLCRIGSIEKRRTDLAIIAESEPVSPESSLDLILAATLLKGDKIDLVVQKAVELGVNEFIPMTSVRCDVKASGASKRSERLRRIAMEATKQCGRAKLMSVGELIDYRELINETNGSDTTRIHFSERDGEKFEALKGSRKILAFIGPEGGWDDAEMDAAAEAGIRSITFGGRVMKADTAAISIAAILQHRFGDVN